jgi:hypothetical protein
VDDQTLEVRVAVGFAGAVMPVVLAKRGEFLKPLVDVLNQAVFGVVDVYARGDVHGGNEDHSFADSTLCERGLHLRRDVDVFPVFFRAESEVFRVELHTQNTNEMPGARLTPADARRQTRYQ